MHPCPPRWPALALLATLAGPAPALAEPIAPALGGFHVGAFLGGVQLRSSLDVPARGPFPATTVTDQGASGLLFGGVAGYGRLLPGGLYLGAEVEIAVPQNVVSRVRVYNQEMRARLTTDGGVFLRGGYSWDGRSLVFARAGVTLPRQAFETVGGREVANRWLATPALGAGAEFLVAPQLALRLDATYTFPGGENPVDSLRGTLGLSWRF
jgi:hypothetical protein